jgi:YihY family inner membrane protein
MKRFHAHNGLLLAGALAYNGLLSLVPLAALAVIGLSHFVPANEVVARIGSRLEQLLPGAAPLLSQVLATFLERRAAASGVVMVTTVIFSALGFVALNRAIATIFESAPRKIDRHALMALLLPLSFVAAVLVALLVLSLFSLAHDTASAAGLPLLQGWLAPAAARLGLFAGHVVLLASFYRILPQIHVSFRIALIGAASSAVLWEIVRAVLSWYFSAASAVGVVYGSLATAVVLLVSLEIGAAIILLGAQVIAEMDRSDAYGLPWWQEPTPNSIRRRL